MIDLLRVKEAGEEVLRTHILDIDDDNPDYALEAHNALEKLKSALADLPDVVRVECECRMSHDNRFGFPLHLNPVKGDEFSATIWGHGDLREALGGPAADGKFFDILIVERKND